MLEARRGSTLQSGVFYLQQPTVIQFSKRYKELIICQKVHYFITLCQNLQKNI